MREVYLVDGTYELFRHYYAMPRARDREGREVAAVRGVLLSVLGMINGGATHIGVATDHVIESFRNRLWPAYKTGDGIDPDLLDQFQLLEDALVDLGVAVWPMIEYEADDALAAAAAAAALARFGHLEAIPSDAREWGVNAANPGRLALTLVRERDRAFLFRDLATLRTDIPLFESVDDLRWTGPTPAFAGRAAQLDMGRIDPST